VSAPQTLPAASRPSTTASATAPAPASTPRPAAAGAPRRVRLTVSRVDPWSAMKLSFLVSVALGIALVVMTAVLWMVLGSMGVFDQINSVVGTLMSNEGRPFDVLSYVGFGRVVSLSIVFAVVDVILLTAVSTLGAFIYNVSANLVGGLHLTLTDD
jgi:ABC-type glycerol-3-phosphate transport system permease component